MLYLKQITSTLLLLEIVLYHISIPHKGLAHADVYPSSHEPWQSKYLLYPVNICLGFSFYENYATVSSVFCFSGGIKSLVQLLPIWLVLMIKWPIWGLPKKVPGIFWEVAYPVWACFLTCKINNMNIIFGYLVMIIRNNIYKSQWIVVYL